MARRVVGVSPVVLGLALLVLASVLAAPAEGMSRVRQVEPVVGPGGTLYGVHQDLTFSGDAGRRAEIIDAVDRHLHPQVSRNSLLWHRVEPRRGARDWSVPDAVVDGLVEAGIRPLLVVYGSPSWANGVGEQVAGNEMYVPEREAAFRAWLTRYREFVRAAAARYRGKVVHWELWNEPNEGWFWKPRPSPERYARFYREMRRAILEVNPGAQVAVGGLPGADGSVNITAPEFLRRLRELRLRPDIVALHPYTSDSLAPETQRPYENDFVDIEHVYQEARRGNPNVELWLTEWGWSTGYVSPVTQAAYLERSLELVATRYRYVSLATVFLDHDRPPRLYHGLLDAELNPKPAGEVFARFVTGR